MSGIEQREAQPTSRSWTLAAGLLVIAGAVVLITSLTVFKISNNDIWIHLKTGQIIAETWHLPSHDTYSFTASDRPYVVHEWLSEVVFYYVFAATGVNGLILFKSAIVLATCGVLSLVCRFLRVQPALTALCIGLMAFVGSSRFVERPHIFSGLFLALYLLCYFGFRERGRRRIWLYSIPVLNVLWTNLHGGYIQGIFLLVVLAAAEALALLRARRFGLVTANALPARDLGVLVMIPFACAATSMINPLGFRLLLFPFEIPTQKLFLATNFEWKPLLDPVVTHTSMFVYYIVWIALLLGSFLAVRDHSELRGSARRVASWLGLPLLLLWAAFVLYLAGSYRRGAPLAHPGEETFFWGALAGVFVLCNLHQIELQHAGIAALFLALSLRSNRSVSDAVVATLPTLAHNVGRAFDVVRGRMNGATGLAGLVLRLPGPPILASTGLAMLGLGILTFQTSYYIAFDPPLKRESGLGIASTVPVASVEYITKNHITGKGFASYEFAGRLIFETWPGVRVAMDSRNDVYGQALTVEYRQALKGGAALESYLGKWPVDFFLINFNKDRDAEFFRTLRASGDWTLVYFDDLAVVYLKTLPKFAAIISRDGYTLLDPTSAGAAGPGNAESAGLMLAEADRAVAAAPSAWRPWHFKARALIALGRLREAEAAERQILEIDPDVFIAWADLGNLQAMTGRKELAAEAFERCLELCPDCDPCRTGLNLVRRSGAP